MGHMAAFQWCAAKDQILLRDVVSHDALEQAVEECAALSQQA